MWDWYFNIARAYITSHSRGDFASLDLIYLLSTFLSASGLHTAVVRRSLDDHALVYVPRVLSFELSERVPGLGQITWWIVMPKKLRGHLGKKFAQKSRNSWIVNGRGCGCIGTVDLGPKCAQFWNQMKTLKYLFCCHMYCVHVCTHLYRTVITSRVVSNRDSQYPPLGWTW